MKLKVAQIDEEGVYKDLARIPERHRTDHRGRAIEEGRICKVTAGDRSVLLSLRGQQDHSNPTIHIDEKTRKALGLTAGKEAEFQLRKVSWLGQFLWAWRATDPAYRIAARLGLLSVVLGGIGLALGIVSIWISLSS